jgi:hypothetical protein
MPVTPQGRRRASEARWSADAPSGVSRSRHVVETSTDLPVIPQVNESITTLMDTVAVALIAVATVGTLWPRIEWASLFVAGAVLICASALSTWRRRPRPVRSVEPPAPVPLPGPEDAGTLHVRGVR